MDIMDVAFPCDIDSYYIAAKSIRLVQDNSTFTAYDISCSRIHISVYLLCSLSGRQKTRIDHE
jgi:hypothetical protein